MIYQTSKNHSVFSTANNLVSLHTKLTGGNGHRGYINGRYSDGSDKLDFICNTYNLQKGTE